MRGQLMRFWAIGLVTAGAFGAVGCGESDKIVVVTYDFKPKYEVPERIKKLAISQFENVQPVGNWGVVVADKLASELDNCNKKFGRYKLYDRSYLARVMAERDLKLQNITNIADAQRLGQSADVDAIIVGKIDASYRDQRLSKQQYDFASKTMKTVYYTQRSVTTVVTFTMIDVTTAVTLKTETYTETYDSEKDPNMTKGEAFMKAFGMGGEKLASPETKINEMIDTCVARFVGVISPCMRSFQVKLEKGKSSLTTSGNSMASAGNIDKALELYQQALQQKPDDVGTIFNIGVMYEAKGDLKKAEETYQDATIKKDNNKFRDAYQRVRTMASQMSP